jgi:group I intron endonuclease
VKAAGIYRIELGNGHFYVGSSSDLANRERQHRNGLLRGNHGNPKMQNCWNKYKVFEFIVLDECGTDELLHREQLLIDAHINDPKNANLAPTAGSALGFVHSAATRAKLSALRKGIPKSPEWRAKLSASQTGRKRGPFSPEWRANLAASQKGKGKTAEHRANLSAALTGKRYSASHCAAISAGLLRRRARMEES